MNANPPGVPRSPNQLVKDALANPLPEGFVDQMIERQHDRFARAVAESRSRVPCAEPRLRLYTCKCGATVPRHFHCMRRDCEHCRRREGAAWGEAFGSRFAVINNRHAAHLFLIQPTISVSLARKKLTALVRSTSASILASRQDHDLLYLFVAWPLALGREELLTRMSGVGTIVRHGCLTITVIDRERVMHQTPHERVVKAFSAALPPPQELPANLRRRPRACWRFGRAFRGIDPRSAIPKRPPPRCWSCGERLYGVRR